ncbi:MAG: FAD-dependent oxidoreductase [Chloroflexi bacterium]|nr:FAD-dependent oxidoreductase [Chloroflexota bacterium]
MEVIVVGGGVAGFSAATVAKKAGATVTLIERTDMLGGLGLHAGMGLPGFWETPVRQEQALGGADIIAVFESIATHKEINTPGYKKLLLYNVTKLDATMQRALREHGVRLILGKRVADIDMTDESINAVILADSTRVSGDVFVDATGTVAGIAACERLGFGCVECMYRCPTFGNPGGLTEKNKRAKTYNRIASDGKPGTIGTSVMVPIASLSDKIQQELREKGYVSIPVPPGVAPDLVRYGRAGASTTALMDQDITKLNILLLDIGGFVKVTATGSPLYARSLRSFPGLENSVIMQPTAGARGHLIHGLNMVVRDNCLKVDGFANLFAGGAKSGPSMCLIDCMVTGDLAGHNAVRKGLGQACLELPTNLAAGAFIDHVGKARQEVKRGHQGIIQKEFLQGLHVYREGDDIGKEVEKAGLKGVYQTRLC